MSLAKVRLKILQKIAQTVPSDPTTSTATPNTTTNAAVAPDPSPLASSLYPSIRVGWDSARVAIIESLVRSLSSAANIATNGQYNLQTLRNQNFQFDPSSFTSPDQKNLLVFFLKVYKTLLNAGQAFTQALTADQVSQMIPYLLQSPELANLSTINPTGQIAQKSTIPGNFKDGIRDMVARLQPTVTTRRA
jgi:hypothetical protein